MENSTFPDSASAGGVAPYAFPTNTNRREIHNEIHCSTSYTSDWKGKLALIDDFGKQYNESLVNWVYWSRLVLSFSIFSASVILMSVVQIIGDQFYEPLPPLKDAIHALLPNPYPPIHFVNMVELLLVAFTFSIVTVFTNRHMRFLLLTRAAIITSVCYWIRAVAIIVTILPDPLSECYPIRVKSAFEVFVAIFQLIAGQRFSCTDIIVSGHCIIISISWIFLCIYFPKRKWITISASLYALFNAVILVTSQMHYTIDVFLAIALSCGVAYVYHVGLDYEVERLKRLEPTMGSAVGTYGTLFATEHAAVLHIPFFKQIATAIGWCEALPQRLVIGIQYYMNQMENKIHMQNPYFNINSSSSLLRTSPLEKMDYTERLMEYLTRCSYMGTGDIELPSVCIR